VRCTSCACTLLPPPSTAKGAPPLLVPRSARGNISVCQLRLLARRRNNAVAGAQALASVSAHAAAFRRRFCARPRTQVQYRCAALARGRTGAAGCGCCRCRESTCRPAGARRRFAAIYARPRALCITRVRRARLAGQQVTAATFWGGAVFPGVLFPRPRDASTRDGRRAHYHSASLNRLHRPTPSEMWVAKHAMLRRWSYRRAFHATVQRPESQEASYVRRSGCVRGEV